MSLNVRLQSDVNGADKLAHENARTDEALLNEKADYEPATDRSHNRGHRKCTTKRVVKIVLLSIFVPIGVLALAIGGWLLYVRLSYNPPPAQYSNKTELVALFADLYETNFTAFNLNSTLNSSSVASKSKDSSSMSSLLDNMVAPPWSDCGSALSKVQGFFIDQCNYYQDEKRCTLPLEKDGNMRVVFRLNDGVTVTAPTFNACGKAIYTGTPCRNQPFSKPDPCVDSGLTCPLESGKLYAYHNYGGVHQKDLPITLTIDTFADTYLRLRDPSSGKLVFCVRMPSVIDVEPFEE